jgi:hypothetical protein
MAPGNNEAKYTQAGKGVASGHSAAGAQSTPLGYSEATTAGLGAAGVAGKIPLAQLGPSSDVFRADNIVGVGTSTAPKYNEPQDDVLDRSHPLRDGSGAAAGHINPVGAPEASISEYTSQSESIGHSSARTSDVGNAAGVTGSHINPIGAPSTTNATTGTTSAAPGATSAAILGTGVAATGGLAASSRAHDDTASGAREYQSSNQSQNQSDVVGFGTSTGGDPKISETGQQSDLADLSGTRNSSGTTHHPPGTKLDCNGNPERGYVHHVSGPHSTDIANQLDPGLSSAPTSTHNDRGEVIACGQR